MDDKWILRVRGCAVRPGIRFGVDVRDRPVGLECLVRYALRTHLQALDALPIVLIVTIPVQRNNAFIMLLGRLRFASGFRSIAVSIIPTVLAAWV